MLTAQRLPGMLGTLPTLRPASSASHPSAPPPLAGTPQNVTYAGGVGKVTISWEAPAVEPDPATTKYWLYATPMVSSRRRLLGEGQTAFAELKPSGGNLAPASGGGSFASPFSAVVSIPGEGLGEHSTDAVWLASSLPCAGQCHT